MPIGIVSDSDFLSELSHLKGETKGTPVSIPVQEINEPITNDKSESTPVSDHLYPENKSYPAPQQLVTTVPGGTISQATVQTILKRGRKEGDNNVPDSLRKLIAETALMDGREAALALARDFGLSASSVAAYTNGATSTTSYNEPKKDMITHINGVKERAIRKASKTLNGALKAISQDKLDNTDAKDLAGIARDMTVVIKNLTPDNSGSDDPAVKTPQFVVFAPQFRDERSFEQIVINE